MRRTGQVIGAIALLVLLAGAVGGVIWLIVRGIESNPSVVGSLATAAGAVVAVVAGRSFDKRRELRQAHRERIAPLYEELIDVIRNIEDHEEAELEKFFKDLAGKLIMYSPAHVIKAWIALSRHTWLQDGTDRPGMLLVEGLLRQIRKDMGHHDRSLGLGDLQRLYVTDADDVLGPFSPSN
jgi:hypothetical protein